MLDFGVSAPEPNGTVWVVDDEGFPAGDCLRGRHEVAFGAIGSAAGTMAFVGDVNGDGFDDFLVGATLAPDPAGVTTGAVYLLHGPLGSAGALESIADAVIYGEQDGALFGAGLAGADLNGDGFADLVIGAPGTDGDAGAVYVFHGPLAGLVPLSDAHATLRGQIGDLAGTVVHTGHDLSGDGVADLAIAAHQHGLGGAVTGAVYVVHMPVAGDVPLANADATYLGEAHEDLAGNSIDVVPDVNGDGHDDLLVGAPHNQDGGVDFSGAPAGKAYLVLGPHSGTHNLADAYATFWSDMSSGDGRWLGGGVSSAGDFNADGHQDLVVGSFGNDDYRGAAYLFLGPVDAGVTDLSDADVVFLGEFPYDNLGGVVLGLGDLDADGYDDIALGAIGVDELGYDTVHQYDNNGAVYIIPGQPLAPSP